MASWPIPMKLEIQDLEFPVSQSSLLTFYSYFSTTRGLRCLSTESFVEWSYFSEYNFFSWRVLEVCVRKYFYLIPKLKPLIYRLREENVPKHLLCSGGESWVCLVELKRWVVSAGTWLDAFCCAGSSVTSVSGKESSPQERWATEQYCLTELTPVWLPQQ